MPALFSKIGNQQTLSQEIVQKIEAVIRQKKVLPAEKLPTEKELCRMFGVSRTALREALQMLSARGLISIRKGSGIYVNDYSSAHVIEPMNLFLELKLDRDYILYVVEVRKMFEPTIAQLAALNRSEDDLRKLSVNLQKLQQSPPDDCVKQGQIDRDFHLIIANACRNPIIPLIVTPIFQLMPRIRSIVYANVKTAQREAVDYHQRILMKIRDRDPEGAYQAMIAHLQRAERHSKEILSAADLKLQELS
ncbi:MAG TPA: FadR family transcriptional regulator [Candidatus Marinimicrobia bacterium]|nr:FadR family transcriptional regulator [Candidatus Neomarinimicrobiota bacterium]